VLDELGRAYEELQREADRPRQLIRLTTECNTVYHWLPSRLRLFQRTHPDAELAPGVSSDPVPALRAGEVDLAILYRPVSDTRLRLRRLFEDALVVVMPPGHRLSRSPFVSAADFARERLIVWSMPREANLVFREVLIPAGVAPDRVTHIQLTEDQSVGERAPDTR
jgi:LysR family transcriptional regulator for metE and metH